MDDFRRYFASLVGSWESAAIPHAGAVVVRGEGFVAARFPYPVLNNAILTRPTALDAIRNVYAGVEEYAVWSEFADRHSPRDWRPRDSGGTSRPGRCCVIWPPRTSTTTSTPAQ